MTLQRRLLVLLLVGAPLVWTAGLLFDRNRVQHEVNELFDTQLVLLAQQVLTLPPVQLPPPATEAAASAHDAQPSRMAIVAWQRDGQALLALHGGTHLPFEPAVSGFVDRTIDRRDWRIYYLQSEHRVVAIGHQVHERRELINGLTAGQLLPWLLTLPVLLLVMTAAVRTALAPLRQLASTIEGRSPSDLRPLPDTPLPAELQPVVRSMNTLLARMGRSLEQERRFTADAAHELRTPLAALQAQWDALQAGAGAEGRAPTPAEQKVGAGLARLERLVTQMLALARVEHAGATAASAPIDWPALVESLFSEMLPLAEVGRVELACDWPDNGASPWPQRGDEELLRVMLRNLLHNALRHAPAGSTVALRLSASGIEVVDAGPGVPEALIQRLGARFFRLPGQGDGGSGLGLSIVRRIAEMHGLTLSFDSGKGFTVRLARGDSDTRAAPPPPTTI